MSNEVIFKVIADLEGKHTSLWGDHGLAVSASKSIDDLRSKISNNLLDAQEISLFALSSFALGLCGALINREIETRKGTKKLCGAAYVLMDRLAEQIALKSSVSFLYGALTSGEEKTLSLRTKARFESLVQNIRSLLVGMTEIQSLAFQLDKFGAVTSELLSSLGAIEEALDLKVGLEKHLESLAA